MSLSLPSKNIRTCRYAATVPFLRGHYGRPAGAICGGCLAVSILLADRPVLAQEAIRNAMTEQVVASRRLDLENMPYSVKTGDLRMLVTPSLGLDWNDNITTVEHGAEDDFILRPLLGITAGYPLTQYNLLRLDVTFGYLKYFKHDEFSNWYVQSGSELSFDIFVKDFRLNLHDRFSYIQDSSQEPAVAATGNYGNLDNVVGAAGTWDLNDVTLVLSYDHQNVMSTTDQFQSQNRGSELVVGRAGFRVHPRLTTGIEGSGSFTSYQEMLLNDNQAYTAGAYVTWQPGTAFQLQAHGGYSIFQFQHTSPFIQTGDMNSWYVGLTAIHQITEGISYVVSAGHDIRLGIESDAIEEWYIQPAINWSILKNWTFQTSLSYQNGQQGIANRTGNLKENYDWLGVGLSVRHPITDRLTLGLSYRLTLRSSDLDLRSYDQNVVGLQLSYQL